MKQKRKRKMQVRKLFTERITKSSLSQFDFYLYNTVLAVALLVIVAVVVTVVAAIAVPCDCCCW